MIFRNPHTKHKPRFIDELEEFNDVPDSMKPREDIV